MQGSDSCSHSYEKVTKIWETMSGNSGYRQERWSRMWGEEGDAKRC